MSTALLSGNLAFAEHDGILYSSGLINGHVSLRGPLSQELLTIGVGLRMGAGTHHWLQETGSGSVGIFHAGDEHDALYTPGSLYATATLSIDHLEELADREELVLNHDVSDSTGILARPLAPAVLKRLRHAFELVHCGVPAIHAHDASAGEMLVQAILGHVGRDPRSRHRSADPGGHARIVRRARAYILDHLEDAISLEDLADAAAASRRSLYRAFAEILDDTPQTYVRRLRLHRIRKDLASEQERATTVAIIANRWGMSELGRMAGWYRELFGERPSETLAATQDTVAR